MNLHSHFRSIVKEVPRLILVQYIEEKLVDHGIDHDKPLANAIAEHILSSEKEPFSWEDEKYGDVKLQFAKEDFEEVQLRIDNFLKNNLPSITQGTVTEVAKVVVRRLAKDWPEQAIHERTEMRGFCERLQLRWKKGLDPLRMLLTCSREIGQSFAESLQRSKAKKGIARREVLMFLHTRACQVVMEIVVLLESGLADGALARWRTLYELWIIAALIDMYGDEIARRYLDHEAVAMKRAMDNELRFQNDSKKPIIPKKTQREIKKNYEVVIAKYGQEFGSAYGWATHYVKQKNPRFQILEDVVTNAPIPPSYKWASFKVHAGVVGLVHTLGNPTEQFIPMAGSSNAGLEEPAIYAAYSLTQITSLLYGKTNRIDKLIELGTLCQLRDKVKVECNKAARKLAKEEKEIARSVKHGIVGELSD